MYSEHKYSIRADEQQIARRGLQSDVNKDRPTIPAYGRCMERENSDHFHLFILDARNLQLQFHFDKRY